MKEHTSVSLNSVNKELRLTRIGNPVLRQRSRSISKDELKKRAFQVFLDRLMLTCQQNQGVGIAAPQVNRNLRVIVVHVDANNPRYKGKKPFPPTIVINPRIVSRSKSIAEDWEGDLSCDLRALVPRSIACTVTGIDRTGKVVVFELKDPFHARVFLHEIDHLNGVMFLDRVKNKRSISEPREWKKYWQKKD